jgi:hypothetical protein
LGRGAVVKSAKPGKQGPEALAVFFGYRKETQAKATAAFYVANDGVGFDAALLNEEVELGGHALFHLEMGGLDE